MIDKVKKNQMEIALKNLKVKLRLIENQAGEKMKQIIKKSEEKRIQELISSIKK